MATRELCILESGYSVLPNERLRTRSQSEGSDAFDKFILNKPYLDTNSVAFFHVGIDRVFKEFKEDEHIIRDFDFRERVLKEVFNVFKNYNLIDFMRFQKSNPRITSTHMEFILDTFKYLLEGRRNISIETWNTVIEISRAKKTSFIKENELEIILASLTKVLTSPVDTVAMWTTGRNDGFYDMLTFMGIVFGSKDTISTIG